MATQELLIPEANAVVRHEPTLMEVISAVASNPQVDVSKMEALLGLKERLEARDAEREFNAAMARLQPRLPRIRKNGTIDFGSGKKAIKFARWEDIDSAIRPLLTEEGFSLSFTSKPVPAGVSLTAILSHRDGHAKSSEMQLPPDAGPGRNALQAIGSARSYGKRYLACDMLNIITENEDDDGNGAHAITDQQVDAINDLLAEIGGGPQVLNGFLKFMEVATVRHIQSRDYKKAITALEAKRRGGK